MVLVLGLREQDKFPCFDCGNGQVPVLCARKALSLSITHTHTHTHSGRGSVFFIRLALLLIFCSFAIRLTSSKDRGKDEKGCC